MTSMVTSLYQNYPSRDLVKADSRRRRPYDERTRIVVRRQLLDCEVSRQCKVPDLSRRVGDVSPHSVPEEKVLRNVP